ncbi:hypothetical protein NKR19_g6898 [Coniochaeta hoffmannii]|uniref:Uncharacterized protein n=1 Tax=Coniochaeta hoffmannii TaxID=91930 RepID=A0AA38RDC0_9PEZI|nr:hypothetical protein NKR19_g6898 [Coniochaeta hoffmannii]
MSSAATPSSSAAASPAASPAVSSDRLRAHLESNPLKFHLKTGNSKWQCTLIHKNQLERQRALRADSSSSTTSSSSASSIGSN